MEPSQDQIKLWNDQVIDFRGYNGSPLIKKAGVQTQWTLEMVQEYIKCANDPVYFAQTYMKIIVKGKGLQPITLFPYQEEMIRSMKENRFSIFATARQAGKALPLDTPIPTPTGWTTMGAINVGDIVFDENGKPTTVQATSPIFINHDCYEIKFDDGSTVIADANHKWQLTKQSSKSHKSIVLTTEEMFEQGCTYLDSRGKSVSRWAIPLSGPVSYKEQDVEIDPYTLGVWLGDGEAASGRITCISDDLSEYKQAIGCDFSPNHRTDHIYTGTIYGLSPKLRKYGVLSNKHIPNDYKFNSVDTRLALLQGLMDTDGWVEKNGQNCIALSYNRYPQLIDDVYELLTGLGFKVFRKKYHKTCSERLYFNCSREKFAIFRLKRKLEKQKPVDIRPSYTSSRFIRSLTKVVSVPTKCISVANDSHLFLCTKHYIPTHNSTVVCAFVLWYMIFSTTKPLVAFLANKGSTAREILRKVSLAYEHIPLWMQHGVINFNKGSIELENGARAIAESTSSDSIRGYAIDFLFIDEAAFVENWEEFYPSTFNTISSSTTTKAVLVSTPNGLNHFWEIWDAAEKGKNNYNPILVTWDKVPGRDDKWFQETMKGLNNDVIKFNQEHNVEFIGSSGTLISAKKLKELEIDLPIFEFDDIKQYARPDKDRTYAMVVDVSEGKGLDSSAFQILDITKPPYMLVCSYRSNLLTPVEYADVVLNMAKHYNNAWILVENNNIGGEVCNILHLTHEYEYLIFTESAGAGGKRISSGFGDKQFQIGVRTTVTVKSVGCSILKMLMESNQIELCDEVTIQELKRFSKDPKKKNTTYCAEAGYHDDTVMCLVLFAWMTTQDFFKELVDGDVIQALKERTERQIMEDLTPFAMRQVNNDPMALSADLLGENKEGWVLDNDPERRVRIFF